MAGIERLELLGAVILAGLMLLAGEIAILLLAFGEGQTALTTSLSAAVSLGLAGYLVMSPAEGRGRRGVLSAVIGAVVTVAVITLLPREMLKGGAAVALAVCLMSCLWVIPHMAALQLLASGLLRLKSRLG